MPSAANRCLNVNAVALDPCAVRCASRVWASSTVSTTGIRIIGNSIWRNSGLAIDLGPNGYDGVTANDAATKATTVASNGTASAANANSMAATHRKPWAWPR